MDDVMERASDKLALPLGKVVRDAKGQDWIFAGWVTTTTGKQAYFVQSMEGRRMGCLPFAYHAASMAALRRKFPGIEEG